MTAQQGVRSPEQRLRDEQARYAGTLTPEEVERRLAESDRDFASVVGSHVEDLAPAAVPERTERTPEPPPPPVWTVAAVVAGILHAAEQLVADRRSALDAALEAKGVADADRVNRPTDDLLRRAATEARRVAEDAASDLEAAVGHRDQLRERFETARAAGLLAELERLAHEQRYEQLAPELENFQTRARALAAELAKLDGDIQAFGHALDVKRSGASDLDRELGGLGFRGEPFGVDNLRRGAATAFREEAMSRGLEEFRVRMLVLGR